MDKLRINGVDKEYAHGKLPSTLSELLEQLDIKAATIVAEVDGHIIERDRFSQTCLNNDQQIELIRFVGGG
jgi:thiamine biosynthesis protein ThiS